jgi:NADPH2:quinone reductase
MIGVNMLRIGDDRPMVLKRCLENVVRLIEKGVLDPTEAKVFPVEKLGEAHAFLEGRTSMGKVSVKW